MDRCSACCEGILTPQGMFKRVHGVNLVLLKHLPHKLNLQNVNLHA